MIPTVQKVQYKVNRAERRRMIKAKLIEKIDYSKHTQSRMIKYSEFYSEFEKSILQQLQACENIKYFKNEFDYNRLKISTKSGIDFINKTGLYGSENGAEVVISEQFLAFYWIICFNSLVEFDFQKGKAYKIISKSGKIPSRKLVEDSRCLLEFAFSLLSEDLKWPVYFETAKLEVEKQIESYLPNPFFVKRAPDFELYISKANGVYVAGLTFIILHELNHYLRKHFDGSPGASAEYDADQYALKILQNKHGNEKKQYLAGIASCFIAIELLEKLSGKKFNDDTHPENYDRIWQLEHYEATSDISYEYIAYCIQRILQNQKTPDKDGFHYTTAWEYFNDQKNEWEGA